MGPLRSFARRLLVQAIVSGTVMAGLQIAARFGPEVFPPPQRTAASEEPASTSTQTTAFMRPAAAHVSASSFAEDPTRADVRAGRFSVWRQRDATAGAVPPRRLASGRTDPELGDVMLFDRCRPDCESRDPLLAFNRRPAATPPAPMTPTSDGLDDIAASSVAPLPEVEGDEGATQRDGIVAATARGGLSVARRLVGTAGSVIGW